MKKRLTLLATAMMLFGLQTVNAAVKLTALSGSGFGGNEGPAKLLDEQNESKWGTWDGYSSNPVYVVMKASASIAPKSYELVSANDTYSSPGRSWNAWKIYGANFASDAEATLDAEGWVLIDSKENQSLDKGDAADPYKVNKLNLSETIPANTYYTYFKLVVEGLEGGWGNYCQMDGFRFTNVKFAPQDVTFTCTAGKNYGQGEGIQKMFDNDCNTKYCNNAGSDCYALVTASEPVFVWGYDITTANDNNGGRKVSKWSLYGTNDETVAANPNAEGWITLSNMGNNSYIEGKNWYTQRFFCDKGTAGVAYKYFKVVLDDGGFVQLSEFRLCYDTHRVVTYNWSSGSDNSKKAFDGMPNPKWEGGNGDFVDKSFTIETADGEPYAVKKYHFTTNDDGSWKNRAPKHWTIEGSNDNSNWTKIAEVDAADAIHNTNFTTYEFTPDNTTDAFRYIKLTLKAMKSNGWSQIGDFQVLATSDVSDKDYYTTMVNNTKASKYESGILGDTDPWFTEYITLYNSLDAVLAEGILTGNYKQIPVVIAEMNKLVDLMDKLKAKDNDYLAFDGTTSWGDGHWTSLVDGKDGVDGRGSTKWGGNFNGNVGDAGHVQYVIFRTKQAIQPYFYRLVTGGDTKTQQTRNWKTWKVYGANFSSLSDATYANVANWTVLDERSNISAEYLPMENCYPAAFDFNKGVNESYLYYMVAVTESNGSQQQMNEMYLCLQAEFEDMRAPLVAYFDDFDTTRPVEPEYEDELATFLEKFEELKTTADAVKLTLLYNECVALSLILKGSMYFVELNEATPVVDGVYQLSTASQLVLFSNCVNGGKGALDAVLTADIELTEAEMPAPIGTEDYPFKGSFDGQGFAVSGFVFEDENANNVGFFGYTSGATIQNVMLKGAKVVGHNNAGGLIGNAQSTTIEMCAVVDSYVEGWDHVAAIAANAAGGTIISNNFSDADIVSRQYQAGGLVGTVLSVTVENNLFAGTVTNAEGDASGLVSRIDGDADPLPVFSNNMVAAPSVSGGNTYAIINTCGRQGIYSNNYTLESTVYSTGEKFLNQKDDENGMQVSDEQATCKSFYAETLGWDMDRIWSFVKVGQYPLLVYMVHGFPAQEVSVSETGYATFVAEAELEIPEGVEVFAVQLNSEKAHLEPIENAIPAGEAVVVKAAANTYQFAYAVEYAEKVSGNELKAAVADVVADGTQYVLADGAEGIGFYQVKAGSTIAAGKGYLEISAANGVKSFYGFESGDATGISDIDANVDANAVIYNLSGQRIQKAQKGINIVNGKKLLK